MDWKKQALDLIAEMKRESAKPRRGHFDRLAAELISQDSRPLVMADNLEYWLKLADPRAA